VAQAWERSAKALRHGQAMKLHTAITGLLLLALAATVAAAEKQWQTGTWGDVTTSRQMVDFGPGSSSFGSPKPASPSMRAMADVYVYVIETDEMHLEMKDVVAVGRRTVDVVPGADVTFALQKNTVYVRDPDGTEHKLRVTKKVGKAKP
jgi:hypothetical protein